MYTINNSSRKSFRTFCRNTILLCSIGKPRSKVSRIFFRWFLYDSCGYCHQALNRIVLRSAGSIPAATVRKTFGCTTGRCIPAHCLVYYFLQKAKTLTWALMSSLSGSRWNFCRSSYSSLLKIFFSEYFYIYFPKSSSKISFKGSFSNFFLNLYKKYQQKNFLGISTFL